MGALENAQLTRSSFYMLAEYLSHSKHTCARITTSGTHQ